MNDRPHLREAGDGALLLQLPAVIDPDVNARAVGIADRLRHLSLRGVRDVVPTFRSVAVYFDPLDADVAAIADAMRDAAAGPAVVATGARHEIPVSYGGEDGPDLDDVATRAGLTAGQVIDLHAGTPYRVFMLGFQPGFAYMGLVNPRLATPRRATPRVRVPAGSVGIAGRQTGIYPAASPGGWQIIGRAQESVFDASRTPAARFAPGDSVVFVPTDRRDRQAEPEVQRPLPSERHVTVLRPGLFTTIQDSGRWGEQSSGVPVAGAMDPSSHALANLVIGNSRGSGTLEVTLAGPELRLEQETTIAVAGADLSVTLDGQAVPPQTPVPCRAGSVLRFGARLTGTRAYIAFDGGVRAEPQWPTTPIKAGQSLPLGQARSGHGHAIVECPPMPLGGARVRVMPGPQDDDLPLACLDALLSKRFTVSPQSNRMGYRLSGATVPSVGGDMISDATFTGGIQIPPSGEPILLMAGRQTTGGYPQVATVISADLPVLGQLAPGDWIEFVACSRAEAVAALAQEEARIRDGR